ncbi:DUF1704 domain-containing protein [Pseudenhygromyxa sp. WMMC2535]|uniref:flavohemoglobin expression-modulating QEGLA motif protein n=1 Tax=Pseudenhygromyxa sp. WMMC2535 TaxID=2712867 RepID=UPI00155753AF|nr:flavohemoglobin expression-modulating QEGLA motif protein [Pseudenhygromyxa sp. WMMC2535]NVB38881.1 DUF1704 domain-containing protein [Pseudenhygromyxa sp. WMMC2535]
MHDDERERIIAVSELLHSAAAQLRVISALDWPAEARERFLACDGAELPEVEYEAFDPEPIVEIVREARRRIYPGLRVDNWLEEQAAVIERSALMLAGVGTERFYAHNRLIYGTPTEPLRYDPSTPLDLANRVHEVLVELRALDLDVNSVPDRSAEDVAARLQSAVREHFGDAAPEIVLVDELSAKARASSTKIRLRRSARFTDLDAAQLLNHEAFVHVATALNGQAQPHIRLLGDSHPGITRTQEGLAVFAELMSGTSDLDRLRRLADRVVAIQMCIDGADFIELYRWFLDRSPSREQAFESARRVIRGGPITGGAPFCKDVSYLFGLLEVSSFVRAAFVMGRSDLVPLLFVGKLDVGAIGALAELSFEGLVVPPLFLPPWVADPRSMLAFLTWSTFMAVTDSEALTESLRRVLADLPSLASA